VAKLMDLHGRAATIADGWQLASTPPNAIADPSSLADQNAARAALAWIPAEVPGTVAAARQKAGTWSSARPMPLGGEDHWFRTSFSGTGEEILRFHGLATLATVWLNGREILTSRNMFLSHDVPVLLAGRNELVICFRSLARALEEPLSGGRWRPRMITPSGLRHFRTTALGHMPGWCPSIDAIGPWRAIERIPKARALTAEIRSRLEGTTGILEVSLELPEDHTGPATFSRATISCAGATADLAHSTPNMLTGRLEIPDVELWWPHTHGHPTLHNVSASIGDVSIALGRTGFRKIEVDRGTDGRGFALKVNGTPIFCRGALWSSADLTTLPTAREAFAPWLTLARDGGMNMIRVPGTTVYEVDAFYDLCDELGLLVWQDFMFANFDYPVGDEAFARSVKAEAAQFLARTAISPALAVLSGGSEVYQQAAMLGLPAKKYLSPLFEEWLPEAVMQARPDLAYVPGSPSGGALPFVVDEGVSHYYGVGGYKRPLTDARHAGVRFAAECLAFANVPPEVTAPAHEPPLADITEPRWKPRIPRDMGAPWDFEDIRDHYLEEIFGVRAAAVRYEAPDRYLELSRATQAIVTEHVFTEWMREGSTAKGGLVLMLQDLEPSAAWGLITSCGAPKSSWYAMKRIFKSVRVTMTDEGVNGLAIHIANESSRSRDVVLRLTAWRDGRTQVLAAKEALTLRASSGTTLSAYKLIGSFFDISYAYRFNPPQHDATVATLTDAATGEVLSEAFHFPCGHAGAVPEGSLEASVERDGDAWILRLKAERLARFVHIADQNFIPDDDWFHLAPKRERRIRLRRRAAAADTASPKGRIRATNVPSPLTFEAKP